MGPIPFLHNPPRLHRSSAEEFVTMRSVTRRWRDGKQLSN